MEFGSDPIQDLIDRQLASLWLDPRQVGSSSAVNYIEIWMVEALDRVLYKRERRTEVVKGLVGVGYTQPEIGSILGVSVRTVRREVRRLKEDYGANKSES